MWRVIFLSAKPCCRTWISPVVCATRPRLFRRQALPPATKVRLQGTFCLGTPGAPDVCPAGPQALGRRNSPAITAWACRPHTHATDDRKPVPPPPWLAHPPLLQFPDGGVRTATTRSWPSPDRSQGRDRVPPRADTPCEAVQSCHRSRHSLFSLPLPQTGFSRWA